MKLFYIAIIVLSGAYLLAQTIAWLFYGKTFFPDAGELFENKRDKNLWQTVFPKDMLRLVIVIFSGSIFGLLMNIVIPEGWITLPLGAVGGITVNFLISQLFSPMYHKLHKSGEPTEKELEGLSGVVTETITKSNFGVINVRHGSREYQFRAVSANERRLPKGTRVIVIYAENSCCFVESEENFCDILFENETAEADDTIDEAEEK